MTPRPAPDAATRPLRLLPPNHHLGWTPYVWLVYLSFFLIEPGLRLRSGALDAGYAAAVVGSLVVFLASYFLGFWVKGRRLMAVVAVQCLLGIVTTPWNTGSSVFFIYAASFAGILEPSRTAVRAIIAISAAGAATSWLTQAPLWYWIPATGMPLLIGFVNLHGAQVERANARLRLAQEQIEHLAAVAERERIARDLHDVLGHTLSLIVLKSELAAKLAPRDAERAAQEIRDVEQVARRALKEVRETIRGYRATLPDELAQSRAILGAAEIRAEIAVEVEPAALERTAEETLALALREAVTNVVRHSGARRCGVRLRADGAACVLEVEDDGRPGGGPEGGGLRGMRQRVESLGGRVEHGPAAAGGGTRVVVWVPRVPGADAPGAAHGLREAS